MDLEYVIESANMHVLIGDGAKMEVAQAVNYIQSGSAEIAAATATATNAIETVAGYAVQQAENDINAFIESSVKPAIEDYIDETVEPTINTYVENTVKPEIDEYAQTWSDEIDAIEEKIPETASSENQLTDKSYVDTALATKQDTISDLATIRAGAALGATAVQPASLATVATSGSYNDLSNKPTIPTVDQSYSASSTNAQSGVAVASAISGKQDTLTAGDNITISNGTISATDTKYTAGTGISITNGVISNTQTSAAWGNITGTLDDQTDLKNALDAKATSSSLATVATSGSYNDLSNKPTIPSQASDIGAQETLVSGTNIKTVNNISLLGSGNIEITAPDTGANGLEYNINDDYMLYLTKDGVRFGTGVKITGGGGQTDTFTLTTSQAQTATVALNVPYTITYTYTSSVGGSASVQYIVNNIVKATDVILTSGNVTKDVSEFLTAGNNVVTIKVTDVFNNTKILTFVVEAIELTISSTFDDAVVYFDDVTVRYTPIGNISKTIYFKLDGETYATATVTTSGRQQTQILDAEDLTHGAHLLEIYATATIDGTTISSNHLLYSVIFDDGETGTPIISSTFVQTTATQGETLNIPFVAYTPNSETTTVTFKNGNTIISTATVDTTKQTWNYTLEDYGNITLSITAGNTVKSFALTVSEAQIDVEPVSENLDLYLTSKNRSNTDVNRDVWAYNNITATMTGFNWTSNGWVADSAGNTVLRIDGGASVTIPLQIFTGDFRTNGKTIEFEFATRAVLDYDSVVVTCYSGDRGIKIKANQALIKSEQSEVETKFKEDEHVRISFVVEESGANRLIYTYINGIISGLTQYPSDDNFAQATPVNITLGSNTCGLDIYNIRVYDSSLSMYDVLNNFIADTANLVDKIALYNANNIYDAYGNVVYNAVNAQVPCMTIIGDLPTAKGDKKTVRVKYEDLSDSTRNFDMSNCEIDVQGTSSQYYPRKNYKIKLPNSYQLRTNSIAEKTFTVKADYMESSHAHNTGLAKLLNNIYTTKTPPQQLNSAVRTAIDGFPITIWYQPDTSSALQYFGAFNFNNDKSSNNTWGMTDGCESWEFSNNTSDHCLFKSAASAGMGNDFEARYPKDYTDYTNLLALLEWVVSCNSEEATGDALAESVTIDGTTYTNDTAAYRIAKFKDELSDHFNLEYVLTYYIAVELFGMVDSRAKNLFLNTYDGQIWYPVFYDLDTSFGLNNEGVNDFSYNIEFHDVIGTQNVYNGESSVLWNMVERAYPSEIQTLYQNLRNNGKLSYSATIAILYNEQIAKICAAQYNSGAEFNYIKPLTEDGIATYLYVAQGSRLNHLQWWLFNRFNYMDSKYIASAYRSDFITLRLYTPSVWSEVEPDADITITPYADQYLGILYGSYLQRTKGTQNVATTVQAPEGVTFNDTETIIYGASQILSVGDLSPLYAGTVDVSKATKLSQLVIGHGGTYSNTNLTALTVGNNTLLKTLDVRNCPNLVAPIDVSGCTNIETVKATGTSTTAVNLPNGGNLQTLELPATITNLTVKNQSNISTFSVAGYTNITTLVLENTNLNSKTIYEACTNIERVRLINVNWELNNTDLLDDIYSKGGIDASGYNTEHGIVTGNVILHGQYTEQELDALYAEFPNINFTLDSEYYATYTITPTPSDAIVVINGKTRTSAQVLKGGTVTWSVSKAGYVTQSGTATISQDTTNSVTLLAAYQFTINTASENTVVINGVEQTTVSVAQGSTVTWSVSRTGYITQSGTETATQDITLNITLVIQQFTYTISATPNDATVVINGSERSSLTADYGTTIEWSVSKTGYLTQTGTEVLTADTTNSVVLIEPVTLTINAMPNTSTIKINGETL